MQAAVIEAAGRPPRVMDREPPSATAGTVTVSVAAAPITPLDLPPPPGPTCRCGTVRMRTVPTFDHRRFAR